MVDCQQVQCSIVWIAMQRAWIAIATLLAAWMPATAAAMPEEGNAKPRILSVAVDWEGRSARLKVVGRDRDDVVRGAEVTWGDGQPAQGLSGCTITDSGGAERRRRGKRQRFVHSYAYPAAGVYTITVRVHSGGCGQRPQQWSQPRTLTVDVR
jgi:hypothetical protein